ncbi:hypothetical protein AYI70_g6288 [Smittium culicis]|uniref:Uncharacterized protein n=1 Tax=Smittium culicis TaxID=133412 RepID=A0A1R1XQL9_9FUNG|nr:hypothetical protein AYI70_g6288 [Smittium culicis]
MQITPSIVQLMTISGYLYSSHHITNFMSDLSDSEFWIEVWNWCCDKKIKNLKGSIKNRNDGPRINSLNEDGENSIYLNESLDLESVNNSQSESDFEFLSDSEAIFKQIDFKNPSSVRKAKLDKCIFSNYQSNFISITNSVLNLFKASLFKEIQRLFSRYFETLKPDNALGFSSSDNISDENSHIKEDFSSFKADSLEDRATSQLSLALRGLRLVIEYISVYLLEDIHFRVILKDVIGNLDEFILENIIFKNGWTQRRGIQLGIDISSINDCISNALKGKNEKSFSFGKFISLNLCKEAAYLISLPQNLDSSINPNNWSGLANLPVYSDPKEIASVVKYKFYGSPNFESPNPNTGDNSVSKLIKTGMNIQASFSRKSNKKVNEADVEAATKLKLFNIYNLSASKVGAILQTRNDYKELF